MLPVAVFLAVGAVAVVCAVAVVVPPAYNAPARRKVNRACFFILCKRLNCSL